jgi:SulP family sulfate permease
MRANQFKDFRFNLSELGGAIGDLGTLLPLVAALIAVNGMNSTSIFFIVGITYIIAGFYYRIPTPVQPLKAVSAIAISSGLAASVVGASGLLMGALLLFLAVTGLITVVARLFPQAIIRGIQLGVGIILVKAGLSLAGRSQVFLGGEDASIAIASITLPVGWLLAFGSGILLIVFLRRRWFPASLAVLSFGIGAGALWGSFFNLKSLNLGLAAPSLTLPTLDNLAMAFVLLVIPQIPLTLGNAVFAAADTARSYFGAQAHKVTPRALLTTMGTVNIAAGLVGSIPVCHGSGGLTAHYKLGARTGGANLIIGSLCLAVALLVDGNVLPLISLVPFSVLGVMVIFVGVQHALLARDLKRKQDTAVALVVALTVVVASNLALGLLAGLGTQQALQLFTRFSAASSADSSAGSP